MWPDPYSAELKPDRLPVDGSLAVAVREPTRLPIPGVRRIGSDRLLRRALLGETLAAVVNLVRRGSPGEGWYPLAAGSRCARVIRCEVRSGRTFECSCSASHMPATSGNEGVVGPEVQNSAVLNDDRPVAEVASLNDQSPLPSLHRRCGRRRGTDGIADEEHRQNVADRIPVAILGAEVAEEAAAPVNLSTLRSPMARSQRSPPGRRTRRREDSGPSTCSRPD